MSDDLCQRAEGLDRYLERNHAHPDQIALCRDLAARVRELEATCANLVQELHGECERANKAEHGAALCIWDDCDQPPIYCEGHARELCLPDRERAERAEAERDALRAENERMRGLLVKLRRENAQADRLWQWHHAIDAALAESGHE